MRAVAIILAVAFIAVCLWWILGYFVRRTIAGELARARKRGEPPRD